MIYQITKITIQLPGQIFAVTHYDFYLKVVLRPKCTLIKEIKLTLKNKICLMAGLGETKKLKN